MKNKEIDKIYNDTEYTDNEKLYKWIYAFNDFQTRTETFHGASFNYIYLGGMKDNNIT